MTRRYFKIITFAILMATSITACTTANYGLAPTQLQGQSDIYSFKIFVGGLSGGSVADAAVTKDIDAFRKTNSYTSYKILNREYNIIPSYFRYDVQFSR